VITNKQKPFVIYEWISQFREVAFPKLCMGRGIGKCELPPTRHSSSYNHLNVSSTTFITYSFIVQTYTKLPLI